MSTRVKGLLLAFAGMMCISPDAVLLRSIQAVGVNFETFVFWKMVMISIISLSLTAAFRGGVRNLGKGIASSIRHILIGSAMQMGALR